MELQIALMVLVTTLNTATILICTVILAHLP